MLMRMVLLALAFSLFATVDGAVQKNSFPLIFEFSEQTEPVILGSPIKTMMLLLSDTEADYHKPLLESFRDVAQANAEDMLYVIVPKNQASAVKKYFNKITYDPAVFLVNRTSGQFARPYNAFTDNDLKDMKTTLTLFKDGFLESVNPAASVADVLTDETFDTFIQENKLTMVKFYAPWCSHCKKLAPEFEKAAVVLGKREPPLKLASVDATSCPKLKQKFAIETFPTMKLFKKGVFIGNYDGVDMTSSGILAFMSTYAKTPTKIFSVEDAHSMFKQHQTVAIGVASDAASSELFDSAASGSDHAFGITDSAEVMKKYSISPKAGDYLNVLIFKKWDKDNQFAQLSFPKSEVPTTIALRESIEQALWPLVMQFQREPAQRRRVMLHPVKDLLLMVVDRTDFSFDVYMDALKAAAKQNNNRMLHLWADTSDKRVLAKLGFRTLSDIPGVIAFNPKSGKKGAKFEEEDITTKGLLKFTDKYFGTGQQKKDEL